MALDAGINFFDTADVYSDGDSERILGTALGARRKDVVLASKVRGRAGPGPNDVGLSRAHIMASVDASLRRLGTDWIDLYQIHGYDALTPLDETLRALDDLVRAGKVRYIGLLEPRRLADREGQRPRRRARLGSLRVAAGVLHHRRRATSSANWCPVLADQQMGLMVWSPLAGGFLSGKYSREQDGPAGSRRTTFDFPPVDRERAFDCIDAMRSDRRRARRERRAGGAGVAARAEARDHDHHRRQERGSSCATTSTRRR